MTLDLHIQAYFNHPCINALNINVRRKNRSPFCISQFPFLKDIFNDCFKCFLLDLPQSQQKNKTKRNCMSNRYPKYIGLNAVHTEEEATLLVIKPFDNAHKVHEAVSFY